MAKKRKLMHRSHAGGAGSHGSDMSSKAAGSKASSHQPRHGSGKKAGDGGPPRESPAKSNKIHGQRKKGHPQQQHQQPVIPFSPEDAILLVGEGDLSFARSLVEHHGCENVTATVLEKDLAELTAKYPHVPENVKAIEACEGGKVLFGVDARKMTAFNDKKKRKKKKQGGVLLDEVGEMKISPSPAAAAVGIMDRIIFNFPHVGGKSTDVNRQVRYNQELLVDFFKRADLSLAPGGSIIVTLFEGEPYTLWNIRDLARHSGLQIERSFVFRPDAYPGYRHARTLGAIRNKEGDVVADGGSWKGEERPARSYVFYRKGEVPVVPISKKRRRSSLSDDDDDDDDDD